MSFFMSDQNYAIFLFAQVKLTDRTGICKKPIYFFGRREYLIGRIRITGKISDKKDEGIFERPA